jgi:NADH-quinone oxidoreductase subunit C
MTSRKISNLLSDRFGSRIIAAYADDRHPRIHVHSADWREIAQFLLEDSALRFDWLACLSGIDYAADEKMAVLYDLWSFELKHSFAVKVFAPRSAPNVPSVCDFWPAANWHEREAFDLLGIQFPGHPDLRRILCADDWVGHPLCKDYVFPRQYHGIPGSVELDWQQKPEYPK